MQMDQPADRGYFDNHHVTHEQGRYNGGVAFVERIVVGCQGQDHADSRSFAKGSDGTNRAPVTRKFGVVLELLNKRFNKLFGALEFITGVVPVLANFPDKGFGHFILLLFFQDFDNLLDGPDTVLQAVVIGPNPGIVGLSSVFDNLQGNVRRKLGNGANLDGFHHFVWFGCV